MIHTFLGEKSLKAVGKLNALTMHEQSAAYEVIVQRYTYILRVPNDMDDFAIAFHVLLWQPSEG